MNMSWLIEFSILTKHNKICEWEENTENIEKILNLINKVDQTC